MSERGMDYISTWNDVLSDCLFKTSVADDLLRFKYRVSETNEDVKKDIKQILRGKDTRTNRILKNHCQGDQFKEI